MQRKGFILNGNEKIFVTYEEKDTDRGRINVLRKRNSGLDGNYLPGIEEKLKKEDFVFLKNGGEILVPGSGSIQEEHFYKNQIVGFKDEFKNDGEKLFVVVEDKGDRVDVAPLNHNLVFPPIETVPTYMLKKEKNPND